MMATDLIRALQKHIDEYGDLDVFIGYAKEGDLVSMVEYNDDDDKCLLVE